MTENYTLNVLLGFDGINCQFVRLLNAPEKRVVFYRFLFRVIRQSCKTSSKETFACYKLVPRHIKAFILEGQVWARVQPLGVVGST